MPPGESPEDCAIREVKEETGLTVKNLRRHGVLQFYAGSEEPDWTVHVFSADSFRGEVRERDEGPVRWFDAEEIPYDKMWEDDAHWLPLVLQGRSFGGSFYFTEDWKRLVNYHLEITPTSHAS